MPRMLSVAVPVLSSVTVCGALTLPAMVLAKVSELCDAVSAASGGMLLGRAHTNRSGTARQVDQNGLDAASLSITSSPLSLLAGGGLEPAATWLIGV
jgi:hypothetical protein